MERGHGGSECRQRPALRSTARQWSGFFNGPKAWNKTKGGCKSTTNRVWRRRHFRKKPRVSRHLFADSQSTIESDQNREDVKTGRDATVALNSRLASTDLWWPCCSRHTSWRRDYWSTWRSMDCPPARWRVVQPAGPCSPCTGNTPCARPRPCKSRRLWSEPAEPRTKHNKTFSIGFLSSEFCFWVWGKMNKYAVLDAVHLVQTVAETHLVRLLLLWNSVSVDWGFSLAKPMLILEWQCREFWRVFLLGFRIEQNTKEQTFVFVQT